MARRRLRAPVRLAAMVAVIGGIVVAGALALRAVTGGAGVALGCARGPRVHGPLLPPGPGVVIGPNTWTTFMYGPDHNPVLPGQLGQGNPLSVHWSFRTGGEIPTAPTVVDGVVYVGSLDHCVYALQATTGRELWAFRTDNQVMSEPLVVDGRVYVGSGNKVVLQTPQGYLRGSGASAIYALDAQTGRKLWSFRVPGEVMPTLVYHQGVVYAATGNSAFYALDARTGKMLWSVATGSIDSMSSPALDGDIAIFGGALHYAFHGVNLLAHRLAWTFHVGKGTPWDAEGGVDDGSPAVVNGVAYVQIPEGIFPNAAVVEFALDAQTGRVLWQTLLGNGVIPVANKEEVGSATVQDGVVYVGSPALHGLWALNAATGKPVWPSPAPLPVGVRTPPTLTPTAIYQVANGRIWVLNRATGALEGSIAIGRQGPLECASGGATIVGNTLYTIGGDQAGTVMAIPLSRLPS